MTFTATADITSTRRFSLTVAGFHVEKGKYMGMAISQADSFIKRLVTRESLTTRLMSTRRFACPHYFISPRFSPSPIGVESGLMYHATRPNAYPTLRGKLWRRAQDIPWRLAEIRDLVLPGKFAELYRMVHPYTMCGQARLRGLY